jgi:uncharacterized protein DUF1698
VDILDEYVRGAPSPQQAIDVFAGQWASALPIAGLQSGPSTDLFADARLDWMFQHVGSIEGMRVLELGPLEGGHTYQLERAGASEVVAIEANKRAYLKCLISKELLGMSRSRFLLGDFMDYLVDTPERFDLVVASGVLYHAWNPVRLLYLLSRLTPRLFVWTHYYHAGALLAKPGLLERFSGTFPAVEQGFQHTLYRYQYSDEHLGYGGFCGGSRNAAHWLDRTDMLGAVRKFGLPDIVTGFEDGIHGHGASFTFLAQRRER